MKQKLFLALLFCPILALAGSIKSPNGNIELKFSLDDKGRPTYEMSYKGKAVINPSHLGLELAKDRHASFSVYEKDLMEGFTIAKEETSTFDETWKPVWGETATIRNHYNELAVTLNMKWQDKLWRPDDPTADGTRVKKLERNIIIRFRVYDDGIGFRYTMMVSGSATSSPSKRI